MAIDPGPAAQTMGGFKGRRNAQGRYTASAGDPPPAGDPLNGGTAALSWSAPQGFQTDAELIVETDGTHDFGNEGPELVAIFDATRVDENERVLPILGPNTVLTQHGDVYVEPVAALPGGVGMRIHDYNLFRVDTVPHTKGFESRTYYWPQEHQDNAAPFLLDEDNSVGDRAWQIKPIWNMADRHHGGDDTNFFMVTWQRYHVGSSAFLGTTFISSNASAINHNNTTVLYQDDSNPARMPFPEPYTTEFLFDQGDVDSSDPVGSWEVHTYSSEIGSHYPKESQSDKYLHVVDGAYRKINHFTYPGYIRGWGNNPDPCTTYDAEIYKTAGPGAAARVVITDNPIHADAKKKTNLEPIHNGWSSSQVRVKLRGGWWDISNLQGAYLCIIGADNEQIGTGVELK